jgi:hypothetical protein
MPGCTAYRAFFMPMDGLYVAGGMEGPPLFGRAGSDVHGVTTVR